MYQVKCVSYLQFMIKLDKHLVINKQQTNHPKFLWRVNVWIEIFLRSSLYFDSIFWRISFGFLIKSGDLLYFTKQHTMSLVRNGFYQRFWYKWVWYFSMFRKINLKIFTNEFILAMISKIMNTILSQSQVLFFLISKNFQR